MKLLLIFFHLLCLLQFSSGESIATKNATISKEDLPNYCQKISITSQQILPRLESQLVNSDGSVYSVSEHLHPPPTSLPPALPFLTQLSDSSSPPNSGDPNDGVRGTEVVSHDSVRHLLSSSSITTVTSPGLLLPDSWESHDFNWWNFLRFLVMLHLFHLFFPTLSERCPAILPESSEPLSLLLCLFFPTHPERCPTIPSESSESLSAEVLPFNPLHLRCSSGDSIGTENASITNEGLPNYTQSLSSNSQQILSQQGPQLINSDGAVHSRSDHLHSASSTASSSFSNSENSGIYIEKLTVDLLQETENFTRSQSSTKPSTEIPRLHDVVYHEQQIKFANKCHCLQASINMGPNLQCQANAKKVKHICFKHILQQQPGQEKEDTKKYLEQLLTDMETLRAYNTSEVAIGEKSFLVTQFLDGCYIYSILSLNFNPTTENPVADELAELLNTTHDLLRLENQIPFKVVEIIDFIFKRGKNKKAAAEALRLETGLSFKSYLRQFIDENAYDKSNMPKKFCHLPDLLHLLLKPSVLSGQFGRKPVENFRRAKDYYDQGISFKVKKLERGSASSILDVTFSSSISLKFRLIGCELHIPQLTVNPEILCILCNLVAFEKTGKCGNYVTEYVRFLTLLLREEEDVKLLSKKGIIDSQYSYAEVKSMVQELGKLVRGLSGAGYMEPIYLPLEKHYHSGFWKWFALFGRKVKKNFYVVGSWMPYIMLTLLVLSYLKK